MKLEAQPFGTCIATSLAIRPEPEHRSELLSQLLFGESFSIEEKISGWYRIRTIPTRLEGWIASESVEEMDHPGLVSGDESAYINLQTLSLTCPLISKYPIQVLPGSTLPAQPAIGGSFYLGKYLFLFDSPVPDFAVTEPHQNIEALSLIFINAPFLHGGRSLYGIDNTGLIQLVYKMRGINLPRNFQDLIRLGLQIPFAHDAKAGDLAFFEDESGAIIHAGIITQPGKIVHVYGTVREDILDHAGIYCHREERYLFYLRLINRLSV